MVYETLEREMPAVLGAMEVDEEGNLAPRILKPELLLNRIDEIGDSLRDIAAKLSQRLDELAAHPDNQWRLSEVELKFSLDLEAEAGVIIARTSGTVGFEATLTAQPIDPLTIIANVGYINAKLVKDSPDLGGVTGERLPNTPRFTTSLSGDYNFPLGQLQAFAGATYRFVGERFSSFNHSGGVPQYRLPSYSALDLRTGVTVQAARIELYVRNVTDQAAQLSSLTQTALLGGPAEVIILQPRTVGLSVSMKF